MSVILESYTRRPCPYRPCPYLLRLFKGPPPKIPEGQKTSKFRRDFRQLSTLIVNISETGRHVEHQKKPDQPLPLPRWKKKMVNFGPQTKKVLVAHIDQPSGYFSGDYISAIRGCCALNFLNALEIDQGYLAHNGTTQRVPASRLILQLLATSFTFLLTCSLSSVFMSYKYLMVNCKQCKS